MPASSKEFLNIQATIEGGLVQILLASVKGTLFLHCLGWQELNGTHLQVSVFL